MAAQNVNPNDIIEIKQSTDDLLKQHEEIIKLLKMLLERIDKIEDRLSSIESDVR